MLTFVTLFSDTMQRANENPLSDGGKWTTFAGEPVGDQLEVLNNVCTCTTGINSTGISFLTGISAPNDQWCSLELIRFTSAGDCFLVLRSDTEFLAGINFEFLGPFNDNTGESQINCYITDSGGNNIHNYLQASPWTFQQNDIILVGVQGQWPTGKIFIYQNGTQIFSFLMSAAPSTHSSGSIVLFLETETDSTAIGVSNFLAGSFGTIGGGTFIGWSPLDCRQAVPGFGPAAATMMLAAPGIYCSSKSTNTLVFTHGSSLAGATFDIAVTPN